MRNNCCKSRLGKILMVLCCLIPVAIAGFMYFGRGQINLNSSILNYGLILLCPLSHLILMPLLHKRESTGTIPQDENKPKCH